MNSFIIDMTSCTGCYACSVACKDRAGLPDELDFLRVEEHEAGLYPNPTLYFRVLHCFHCVEPPCVEVCPTHAMSKSEDGIVLIDAEKCTGCEECINVCPFDAIAMLPEGDAAKCDGCFDEVGKGFQPTCVRACPMRALRYEPVSDTHFEKRARDADFENHGVEPAVLYLRR